MINMSLQEMIVNRNTHAYSILASTATANLWDTQLSACVNQAGMVTTVT
jgi:hypothetical protein